MTDTIPQDILERAREIAGDWTVNERELDQLAESIGALILAERKAQRDKVSQPRTVTTTAGTNVVVNVRHTPKRWGIEIEGMWLDLGTDKARADRIAGWLDYGYQGHERAAAIRNQP